MRGLVVSLIVFLAATAAPALAAPQTPILFDAGLRCPGTKTGVNMSSCKNPKYNARIYEIKKIGFPEIAITNGAADDTHPVWSPNHKRIAFYRAPQATGTVSTFIPAGSALWLMNADGSGQKKVEAAVAPSASGSPSWSSDGTHSLYEFVPLPQGMTYQQIAAFTDAIEKIERRRQAVELRPPLV